MMTRGTTGRGKKDTRNTMTAEGRQGAAAGGRTKISNGVSTSAISFGPVDYGCAWSASGQQVNTHKQRRRVAFVGQPGMILRESRRSKIHQEKRCKVCQPRGACLHSIRRLHNCVDVGGHHIANSNYHRPQARQKRCSRRSFHFVAAIGRRIVIS